MKKLIKLRGLHPHHRIPFGDKLFFDHVHRHIQSRCTGTFSDTRLQHPESSLLNRELQILHVLVVAFEFVSDRDQLFVKLRILFLKREQVLVLIILGFFVKRRRRPGSGNDIFTLCVHEPLAVEFVLTGCGVSRESDTRRTLFSHVTENHGLYVCRGTPFVRDTLDATVRVGTFTVPAFEYRTNSTPELLHRIIWKSLAENIFHPGFELVANFLQVFG